MAFRTGDEFVDRIACCRGEAFAITESCPAPKNLSRPFVFPVYDPQCSNQDLAFNWELPQRPSPTRSKLPPLTDQVYRKTRDHASVAHIECVNSVEQYHKDKRGTQTRPGASRSVRRSRMTMTPSELPSIIHISGMPEWGLERMAGHVPSFLDDDHIIRTSRAFKKPTSEFSPSNGEETMSSILVEAGHRGNGPPDGGLLAWAHVFAGFLVIMNCQGMNLSFGVFQAYYEKVLLPGTSPSRLAWIGSFQCFAIYFSGLLTNPVIRKGVHFRYFTFGGSVLLFTGLLLTSFCKTFWQLFLAQGVLTGVGMGCVFSAGVIILTSYFSTRLGIASALMAAGAPIGGILFPILARGLSGKLSFGWIVRVFLIINAVTMLVANLTIRDRHKPKVPGPPSTVDDAGSHTSITMSHQSTPISKSRIDDLGTVNSASWRRRSTLPVQRSDKLSIDGSYLLMLAGMFFAFWGLFNGFYFIVTFGQDVLHLDDSSSINLLIAMNVSNLIGRVPPGLISDACLGPLNTMIPATFLSSAFALLMTGVETETGVFLVACFYGFAAATLQSLYIGTIYSFVGLDRNKAAARMGMVMAAVGLATLTGAPIGGQLIVSDHDRYASAQVFAGAALAVGGYFFLAARFVKSGWAAKRL